MIRTINPYSKHKAQRAQQLFDAAQFEAEYGADERKPFFFALCERLLKVIEK